MIYDHSPYYYVKEQKRRSTKRQKRITLLFLLIAIPLTCAMLSKTLPKQTLQKEVAGTATTQLINPTPNQIQENSRLKEIVADALTGTKGSYGIAILHLKTGEYFLQDEGRLFKTASLYKLWVMGTAFEQIKNGQLHESDLISGDLGTLNAKLHIASTSADSQSPTGDPPTETENDSEAKKNTRSKVAFTVKNAMEKMITISDNYSALTLTDRVNLANIQFFLDKNGFIDSKVGSNGKDPVTSPYDIALFLKKIYDGELIDHTYSDKMLTLLKQQKLNHKLPKYLPEGVLVAHKTGELDEVTHDAGIVFTPSGD